MMPGCPAIVTGEAYCAMHRKLSDWRPSSTRRGYDARWRLIRAEYLRTHPYCCDPFREHTRLVKATQVHHKIPLDAGGSNDSNNLEGYCAGCHSRITRQEHQGRGE